MSNSLDCVWRITRAAKSIPDDPVDMACILIQSETVVTKVTVIRSERANADDMTAQVRSNAQFLHILRAVSPSTLPFCGHLRPKFSRRAVIRGG
jgi:hypothetical protein